jgi:hypothetical protein
MSISTVGEKSRIERCAEDNAMDGAHIVCRER